MHPEDLFYNFFKWMLITLVKAFLVGYLADHSGRINPEYRFQFGMIVAVIYRLVLEIHPIIYDVTTSLLSG